MRQMARIFLIIESRIIGRRFAGGPCFFPGFGRGVSIPDLISAGYLRVHAMVFSSVALPLSISGGPYFTYSAFNPSSPTLFWYFMLLDAFSISSVVNKVFISAGFMIVGSSAITAVNMFLTCSGIMLACSFSDPAYIVSFPYIMRGFFGLLLFMKEGRKEGNLYLAKCTLISWHLQFKSFSLADHH